MQNQRLQAAEPETADCHLPPADTWRTFDRSCPIHMVLLLFVGGMESPLTSTLGVLIVECERQTQHVDASSKVAGTGDGLVQVSASAQL